MCSEDTSEYAMTHKIIFKLLWFKIKLKINYFQIFIFGTCGANVNIAMSLESFLNLKDSEAGSYKHVTFRKNCALFAKINFLMSQKIRRKQVPTKNLWPWKIRLKYVKIDPSHPNPRRRVKN